MENSLSGINAVLIGSGNVSWHFGRALKKAGVKVSLIYNRSQKKAEKLAAEINCGFADNFDEIARAHLIVLAVSDSAIPEILDKLPKLEGTLVHTAGSIPVNVLSSKAKSYGVIYPFQTLTSGVDVDYEKIPMCIEASDLNTLVFIQAIAEKISGSVYKMNSAQRKKLHLAGIVANNFSNHLFALASDYLQENKLDPKLLLPLINETITKLSATSARDAQTGPARRHNIEIIEDHLAMLTDKPELKNLYGIISDSIIAYYSTG